MLPTADAAARFYAPGIVVAVQEKVDGANLGVSFDPYSGTLRFQNRSHFVCGTASGSQWRGLEQWATTHERELRSLLRPHEWPGRFTLYGEWLRATHSVQYDCLPAYFLAFDLYDAYAPPPLPSSTGGGGGDDDSSVEERSGKFLSRRSLAALLEERAPDGGIQLVPLIYEGPVTREFLLRLLDSPSRFRASSSASPAAAAKSSSSSSASARASNAKLQTSYLEGLYLRVDEGPYLKHRAKLVRPDFIQHIDKGTHWIRQIRKQNRVNYDGSMYDPNANAAQQHSRDGNC